MAAKGGASGTQSLNDALMDAAQAITRAMGTPEATNPQVAQGLTKLLNVTVQLARHGGGAGQQQPPGGGAAPGAAPGAGTPAGVGMGPPGGGAVNPMMGTPGPPPAPGGPGPTGMPQISPDELRRLIGSNT